ncbi:VOC family protein [Halobacillus salinus]|uniref:VOC family protein n=1 Tax=Halobacillus salinus TaxID=192814 RepID=A0A4Z0GV14_9BACI|nr:VOC family protein [Halobacillus salinus]TGB01376.1 VOC family protein [Halobacillus salinus]
METKFFQEPATYVDSVELNVTDLEKSLHFYKNVLGLQVMEQSDRHAALTADGRHPLVVIHQPARVTVKEKQATGLYHFAILVPERKDLARLIHHLAEQKIPLGGADHLVSEAIYFSDPDGNGIEVYHDRSSEEWAWNGSEVAMATDPLDTDGLLDLVKESWNGFPEETRMGHIHLHARELKGTLAYYTEGLGLDIANHSYPQAAFLSTEGYHHHVALNTWKGVGAPSPSLHSAGLRHFTLVYPGDLEREAALQRLEKMGHPSEKQDDAVYVTDPSGNSIKLVI